MHRTTTLSPTRIISSSGLAFAVALGALGALAVPATTLARGADAVVVRATGSCTLSSTARLKAKPDNGRIEVEFEVDQNRSNRLWNVRAWDDGQRVFTGARRTTSPSGSFTLRLHIPNRPGVDTIGARAVNATTGEVCRATVNL